MVVLYTSGQLGQVPAACFALLTDMRCFGLFFLPSLVEASKMQGMLSAHVCNLQDYYARIHTTPSHTQHPSTQRQALANFTHGGASGPRLRLTHAHVSFSVSATRVDPWAMPSVCTLKTIKQYHQVDVGVKLRHKD